MILENDEEIDLDEVGYRATFLRTLITIKEW
jgi:hypothetical protein